MLDATRSLTLIDEARRIVEESGDISETVNDFLVAVIYLSAHQYEGDMEKVRTVLKMLVDAGAFESPPDVGKWNWENGKNKVN